MVAESIRAGFSAWLRCRRQTAPPALARSPTKRKPVAGSNAIWPGDFGPCSSFGGQIIPFRGPKGGSARRQTPPPESATHRSPLASRARPAGAVMPGWPATGIGSTATAMAAPIRKAANAASSAAIRRRPREGRPAWRQSDGPASRAIHAMCGSLAPDDASVTRAKEQGSHPADGGDFLGFLLDDRLVVRPVRRGRYEAGFASHDGFVTELRCNAAAWRSSNTTGTPPVCQKTAGPASRPARAAPTSAARPFPL